MSAADRAIFRKMRGEGRRGNNFASISLSDHDWGDFVAHPPHRGTSSRSSAAFCCHSRNFWEILVTTERLRTGPKPGQVTAGFDATVLEPRGGEGSLESLRGSLYETFD